MVSSPPSLGFLIEKLTWLQRGLGLQSQSTLKFVQALSFSIFHVKRHLESKVIIPKNTDHGVSPLPCSWESGER